MFKTVGVILARMCLVSIGIDQGIVPLVWDVSDKGTNDLIFALWITSKANARFNPHATAPGHTL